MIGVFSPSFTEQTLQAGLIITNNIIDNNIVKYYMVATNSFGIIYQKTLTNTGSSDKTTVIPLKGKVLWHSDVLGWDSQYQQAFKFKTQVWFRPSIPGRRGNTAARCSSLRVSEEQATTVVLHFMFLLLEDERHEWKLPAGPGRGPALARCHLRWAPGPPLTCHPEESLVFTTFPFVSRCWILRTVPLNLCDLFFLFLFFHPDYRKTTTLCLAF